MYLSASLADRYLVNLVVKNERAPCLIKLAVIATLMAAKLEEPIQPSSLSLTLTSISRARFLSLNASNVSST